MGTQQPIRKTVTSEIPDKLYFRIGDVARICEVPTYVLRFWETEFPQLKPNKGGTGQRLYRRRDVELALRIKSLLYDQGYTIPGARQVFKNESAARSAESAAAEPAPAGAAPSPAAPASDRGASLRQQARLRELRQDLISLLRDLSKPQPGGDAGLQGQEIQRTGNVEPKGPAMRPKLVLEPWPKREPAASSTAGPRLQLAQRDLFFSGTAVEEDGPEPPAAS